MKAQPPASAQTPALRTASDHLADQGGVAAMEAVAEHITTRLEDLPASFAFGYLAQTRDDINQTAARMRRIVPTTTEALS